MKKYQFHVMYESGGEMHTRVEFATCDLAAKEQATEWFRMFGYGDEVIFQIDQF